MRRRKPRRSNRGDRAWEYGDVEETALPRTSNPPEESLMADIMLGDATASAGSRCPVTDQVTYPAQQGVFKVALRARVSGSQRVLQQANTLRVVAENAEGG